jgi:hypothetical protein
MILDKKVKVKITKKNIEYYKNFYEGISLKDSIEIDTESQLQKGSNLKINVSCDLCGVQRYIKYQSYVKNINRCEKYSIYTCDKCSHIKLKEYNLNNYGVEYYSQHPDRNEKVRLTSLERFGVDHYSKTDEYIKRRGKTNIEKFGFINPFMDKEKIKSSFFVKYGFVNPSQVEEFKEKSKVSIRTTNENSRYWIPLDQKTDWKIYKSKVRNLTRLSIKEMEWDGTDFYDGEFIRNNFGLSHNDDNYPTIDHKISIYSGFLENIDPEIIASTQNLCWTKRSINIRKSRNCSV